MSSHSLVQQQTDIVSQLGGHRIIVLGDLMLDRYLWGTAERISPEAPVPVVKIDREETRLGGAANVALSLAALGDHPVLVGMVGDDASGAVLRTELNRLGFDDRGLVEVSGRPTSQKTRVVAGNQQVVRVDREVDTEVNGTVAQQIIEQFLRALDDGADAVLISDYGKGTLSEPVVDQAIKLSRARGLFIAVDPKETHFHRYEHVSILTPNHHEACFAAGRKVKDESGIDEIGKSLLKRLKSEYLLITRGEHGMALYSQQADPLHIPAVAQHVFDVTGAGDTVISTITSAVAAGAELPTACRLANVAARRTVAEVGAYAVTKSDLQSELDILGAL